MDGLALDTLLQAPESRRRKLFVGFLIAAALSLMLYPL
jgi:hypothetical protein